MGSAINRERLLKALDEIGREAIAAGTRLSIAVFGGSALLLASNFRFSTEDVDIAELDQPWPHWLSEVAARIAEREGWAPTWLNDGVAFHLSPWADARRDLTAFGTFPRRDETIGLTVFVPTARYLLALKLKALRIAKFEKGALDMADVSGLLRVLRITEVGAAIDILAEFFPKSAADADKQRYVLKRILAAEGSSDAPYYPRRDE